MGSQLPGLWKCLRWEIQTANVSEETGKALANVVARARSTPHRNLQLLIQNRAWFKDTEPSNPLPDIAIALFMPPISSLTRLALKCVPVVQIHALPKGFFPSIVDLALHLEVSDLYHFPWAQKGPVGAFSDAQALRRVSLGSSVPMNGHHQDRPLASPNVLLPWEQLTHFLDFEPPLTHFPSHYTEQCRDLRYLLVKLHEEDVGPSAYLNWAHSGWHNTVLGTLQCVTLNFWSAGREIDFPAFFDFFDVPNLTALRLDGRGFDFGDVAITWPHLLIERFLTQLSGLRHLRYLSLRLSSIAPDTLRRVLQATPHVTTLDAFIQDNYNSFFEGLVWSVTSQVLPRLDTLVLELDHSVAIQEEEGDTIDPDAFRAFLESRLGDGGHNSLRKIIAYSSDEQEMDGGVPYVGVALE